MKNQPMGKLSTLMVNAKLRGVDLTGTDLSGCDVRFADFTGANLTDTESLALRPARRRLHRGRHDPHPPHLTGATLDGAKFHHIKGRDTLVDLDSAEGQDAAIFD